MRNMNEVNSLKELSEKAGQALQQLIKQWDIMKASSHRQFKGKMFVFDINKGCGDIQTTDTILNIKNELAEVK